MVNKYLYSLVASLLYWHTAYAEPVAPVDSGCFISAKTGAAMWRDNLVMETSGVPLVDASIKEEVNELSRLFGVNAQFAFFNDLESPNAYAYENKQNSYQVLFGIRLLHSAVGTLNPLDPAPIPEKFPSIWGGATAGVIAHEWAHTMQFKQRVITRASTNAPLELHADFMAGWYMGMKGYTKYVAYTELVQQFSSMGDNNFNDRNHHGTNTERANAVSSGYQLAVTGTHNAQQAFAEGMKQYDLSK